MWDVYAMTPFAAYKFNNIPKGTFSYWLSHVESKHRLQDKAYFADKWLMKHYIDKYKHKYPLFNEIYYAQILYDFNQKKYMKIPSFNELKNISGTHNGFIVKPNHFSGAQIKINNETKPFTKHIFQKINKAAHWWNKRRYKSNGREQWYTLIKPHIFIEENLNINPSKNGMNEYFIHVFNFKALFCFAYSSWPIHNDKKHLNVLNAYILPEFKLLNISWGVISDQNYQFSVKSKHNLNVMIKFA
eukprot:447198_1